MPVSPAPYDSGDASSTVTSANVTTSDTEVLAAKGNRSRIMLWNQSASDIYVSFGSTCTTSNCSLMLTASGGYFIIDDYKGAVRATVASGSATLWITEWA